VLSTGCHWRYVSKDLPPKSTLLGYFDFWNWDGTLDRLHHVLYTKCREAMDREANPTAWVIDSQSVKSAEKGAPHVLARVTEKDDITMPELAAELVAATGTRADPASISRWLIHNATASKNAAGQRTRSARRQAHAAIKNAA
jgi:hypothetical protein